VKTLNTKLEEGTLASPQRIQLSINQKYADMKTITARLVMSLKEKVAVVTGATGTLGRVVTKTLLEHEAHVIST